MAVAKTKYNTAKCAKCKETPDTHTIKMKKPHGFQIS